MQEKTNVIDISGLFRRRPKNDRETSLSPLVVEGWLLAVSTVFFLVYGAVRVLEADVFDSVTLGLLLVYAGLIALGVLMVRQGPRLHAVLSTRASGQASSVEAEVSDLAAYRERRRSQSLERVPACPLCGAEYAPTADGLCPVCGETQRVA